MSANQATPALSAYNIVLSKMQPMWKLGMTSGVLQVLVGLAIFFPVMMPERFHILVGIMVLVMAITMATMTFTLRQVANPTYGIIITLVRLVTAGLLFFHPLDTNITFTTLMAMFFGLDGALGIGEARKVRLVKPLYTLLLVISIASVLVSASIWLYMKGAQYVTIATLLSLLMFLRGGVVIYMSLLAKKAKPPVEESAPGPEPAAAVVKQ